MLENMKSMVQKHLMYLQDIYVGDITCLQTAFAQDTYGVGYTEKLSDMSSRMKSVLAVNGDSYSNNRNQNNGTIIRNGVIYRNEQTDAETCVLNWVAQWILSAGTSGATATYRKRGIPKLGIWTESS